MFVNKIKTLAIILCAVLCVSIFAGVYMPFRKVQASSIGEADREQIAKNERISVILNNQGEEKRYLVAPTDCGSFLEDAGISLGGEYVADVPASSALTDNMVVTVDKIEYRTETRTEVIPFETVETNVDTIPKGTKETVTEGVDGIAANTYLVKYVNGVAAEEALYLSETVKPSVAKQVNVGVGGVVTAKDGTQYNYSYRKQMEATAYTYMPPYTSMTTATGATLRKGIVAVDPKVIPMHTKMFITGTIEYGLGVAEDTGGAIKGNIIDLAYMSYDECIQFGRRQVQVYILE